jgi:hypothetical protein
MSRLIFGCRFARGGWDRAEWWPVRSPRWDHVGEWVQEEDHLRNWVPDRWSPEQLTEGGPGAAETYTSMVYRRPLQGDFHVAARMSFDHRMAPLIVLASEPANEGSYREYRDHCEVVLFDEGVNVWMHRFGDRGQDWALAAYWRFPLLPKAQHLLRVQRVGTRLNLHVDQQVFGCHLAALRGPLYAGITACEGVNRFFDFDISRCERI